MFVEPSQVGISDDRRISDVLFVGFEGMNFFLIMQEKQDNYQFLLSVYEHVLEHLKDGTRMCDAYNATLDFVESKKPELKDNFTRNIGWVWLMGVVHFPESKY